MEFLHIAFYLKLSFWGSSNNNHPLSNIWALSWGNLTQTHTHTHRLGVQMKRQNTQELDVLLCSPSELAQMGLEGLSEMLFSLVNSTLHHE